MELKEFIKTAIADITNAVSELQEELKNGAIVSPSYPNVIANSSIADPVNKKVYRKISQVDFDVALTVGDSDTIGSNAKAGIQIFQGRIGTENKSRTENVSKITFSIPVVLPTVHVKSEDERAEEADKGNQERLRNMRKRMNAGSAKETTNS